MENNTPTIYTYDLTVFCFDTLNLGYNVVIINSNKYISLEELLLNDGRYIQKEIIVAHNVLKMFIANSFKMETLPL
jgi:hypothetical protein